ncbi:MAG: haloacid dehalogenase [Sphingomonadales bacterium]|nr:haloacid dehalogenase [Sphingomonadales bacterium]
MAPVSAFERFRFMAKHDASTLAMSSERVGLDPPTHVLLANACLFLDFDGVLVEIAARPDAVLVDDRLKSLLSCLSIRLGGRLGIISGRPLCQLRDLLGDLPLAFGGSHGAEIRWPDGTLDAPEQAGGLDRIAAEMEPLLARFPGIVIEHKPYGVALHYRSVPEAEDACRNLAVAISHSSGLTLQSGKMVFELRIPGGDKGSALRLLSSRSDMAGLKLVFIGDDDTDEAAFIVAAETGGAGILVGPERPTAARFRIETVAATIDWLERFCGEDS